MLEHGVGQTQIAFGVLEVDGVDLVRHGGGADFAGDGALLEVAQGNVTPHIAVEVDQDGVEAGHGVEQLGDIVVRLDLGGVGVPGQTQGGNELLGELVPVHFRIGADVGVVVADCTVDLAEDLHRHDLLVLALQTVGDVGHLLAHGARGRRLAVGAGEQRHVTVLVGQTLDLADQLLAIRLDDLFAGGFQHQTVGVVVDVFRGAGEVDELADSRQLRVHFDFLFEEVLHRFHIMVGGALDLFDAGGVALVEVADDAVEQGVRGRAQGRDFRDPGVAGQFLQPANLDFNAKTQQAEFGEDRAQGIGLVAITTVNRGNSSQRGQLHGVNS